MTNYEEIEAKVGDYASFFVAGTQSSISTSYPVFFTARHPMEVVWVSERHTVAASVGSLKIVKLAAGIAPASGTSVLLSDFSLDTLANTAVIKEGFQGLAGTTRVIKEGESLAAVTSGALTSCQGVQVTAYMKYVNRGDFI